MGRWQAELRGDRVDLEGLAIAFSDRPLRVFEDDGQFWLEAEELEPLPHRVEVKPAAERLITRINGAMRLGNPSFQNVRLGLLREHGPDGTTSTTAFVEPASIRLRAGVPRPTILGGVPTTQLGDPARSFLAAATADPDADEALDLWANEPHNWVNLYKVFEIIRARRGFDPNTSELRRFRHTANHEQAAGRQARHARLGKEPPQEPDVLAGGGEPDPPAAGGVAPVPRVMASMQRPRDPEIATKIGYAACENAMALVEEAHLLREHEHHARAFISAVLAMEELGKAWAAYAVRQLTNGGDDDSELWGIFWDLVRHHESKINAALFVELDLPVMAGVEPNEMASTLSTVLGKDIHRKKLRAMYVDEEGGRAVEPKELAADPEVRDLTSKLTKMVGISAMLIQTLFEEP
ncbi:MAG: AbiV family abortive infection protein [Candidatus Limnocylindria bacterium]